MGQQCVYMSSGKKGRNEEGFLKGGKENPENNTFKLLTLNKKQKPCHYKKLRNFNKIQIISFFLQCLSDKFCKLFAVVL